MELNNEQKEKRIIVNKVAYLFVALSIGEIILTIISWYL